MTLSLPPIDAPSIVEGDVVLASVLAVWFEVAAMAPAPRRREAVVRRVIFMFACEASGCCGA